MNSTQNNFNAGIIGLGIYLPEGRMTKKDFIEAGMIAECFGAWGIQEHRVSATDETSSDMSIKAAKNLIKNTGIDLKEIDLIIDCALIPDHILPSNSHRIQYELGAVNSATFDIVPSGGGIIPSLVIADALVRMGAYSNVLLTSSSKITPLIDKKDIGNMIIYGDGAATALVSRVSEGKGFLSSSIITKGEFYSNYYVKMKSSLSDNCKGLAYEKGKGEMAFINEYQHKSEEEKDEFDDFYYNALLMSSKNALGKINLHYDDVDFWIMHQHVNGFNEYLLNKLNIRNKWNYYYSSRKYGNMNNVNLLVNLFEATQTNLIKDNDIVVLGGIAQGLSAGSIVMRWGR